MSARRWFLGVSASLLALSIGTGCEGEDPGGRLASEGEALVVDLPPVPIPIDVLRPQTLRVHTCHVTNAVERPCAAGRQLGPPGERHVEVGDDRHRSRAGRRHAQRLVRAVHDDERATSRPGLDLGSIDSLLLDKAGRDGWCIDRVEIVHRGYPVWYWAQAMTPSDRLGTYVGPVQSPGPVWLDEDRVTAPTSSVRFSDAPQGAYRESERPLVLEIQTCTSAQNARGGTDDASRRMEKVLAPHAT